MPYGFFPNAGQGGTVSQGTVLIVDENIALRKSLRDFLSRMEFDVLEAGNSYEALFLCAQFGPNIRVLLTEINLLPVSGIKLAENVLRLCPHMQIICMAEHFNEDFTKYWLRYLSAEFLQKPFTYIDLHERLVKLLGDAMEEISFPEIDEAPKPTHGEQAGEQRDRPEGNPLFWLSDREYV